MQNVTVLKDRLLDRLRANREAHRALFLKAQEGYRAEVVAALDGMLRDAKEGRPIRRALSLVEPQDHTKDYDTIIDMLDMTVEPEVELSQLEFRQYVRDEWDWAALAYTTNTSYAAGR